MKQEAFNNYKERSNPDDILKSRNKEVTKNDGVYLPFMMRILIPLTFIHISAVYGLYLCFTSAMWKTIIFAYILQRLNMIGVIGGAHRLWSHRSYKAKLPVRIFLMVVFTSAYQFSIRHWVRDHRVHHKYTETDADPHNTNRGMLFAHIGWLVRKRHPQNLKKIHNVDLTDIMVDPVVRFNEEYYHFLVLWLAVVFPTAIPMYFWNETFANSFFVATILRFIAALHEEFAVNSVAHAWGYRPYNSSIKPVETPLLQALGAGEGFHNYHHVFPFDYAASEFGIKGNLTTAFIDLMHWFGLTYNLKTAPKTMIEARVKRNQRENSVKDNDVNSTPSEPPVRRGA